MKTRETTPGKTYSVHTSSGCTVSDKNGWSKTIDAPDGYFTAHAGEVTIDGDDTADVREVFKLAPQRRLALLGVLGGNGGLPAGYKRVEWLESPNLPNSSFDSQYRALFNLGEFSYDMASGDSLCLETCHQIPEIPKKWSTMGYEGFCGINNECFSIAILYKHRGNNDVNVPSEYLIINNYAIAYDGTTLTPAAIESGITRTDFDRALTVPGKTLDTKWHTVKAFHSKDKASISIDGEAYVFKPLTQQNNILNNILYCFGGQYATAPMTGRKKWFKFWLNDELKCHLIPCVDTTGTPCMFDLVSRKPFYNAGTGDFTYPTESTTYSLRRVLPDWGKLTERGLRRLYHAPASYKGELIDYALEHGYKPIVEPEKPEEGYWSPRWTETEDEILLEWVESEPPTDEFGMPAESLTNE